MTPHDSYWLDLTGVYQIIGKNRARVRNRSTVLHLRLFMLPFYQSSSTLKVSTPS